MKFTVKITWLSFIVVALLCISCKRRTLNDVEADGETVEVNIPEDIPDSAALVTPQDFAEIDTPVDIETQDEY